MRRDDEDKPRFRRLLILRGGSGTPDTTAPTLTSPADDASGTTTATISVSTNEGNGRLYWVVTTSATPPTKAQVKAGLNNGGTAAVASGNQAVSSSGSQPVSVTGLTAATSYFSYFMHEDARGNQSSVSAANGFTTDAASSPTAFDPANKSTHITLSGGSLIATSGVGSGEGTAVRSTVSYNGTEKKYCEFTLTNAASPGAQTCGLVNGTYAPDATFYVGETVNGISCFSDGSVVYNNTSPATLVSFTTGDVVCMAVDFASRKIWWRKNGGNWNNNVAGDPAAGTIGIDIQVLGALFAAVEALTNGDAWTANFGATSYAQTPPVGFGNW